MLNKKFTYGSAFAGIGGMTMGLEKLGGKGVIAWEHDPTSKKQYAQDAHKLLHPEIEIGGDICEVDTDNLLDFDVLCFTPPCQAFSVAGKRGGFEDTRGTLTFEALRIAKAKQPKVLFMENVKGLVNHLSNSDFNGIIEKEFILGGLLWEEEKNSLIIKSDIVKKNVKSYLLETLQKQSDFQKDKLDILLKNTKISLSEMMKKSLERGLKMKLISLSDQILQTMKKLNCYQEELIQRYVCNGEGLVSILKNSNLIDNLILKDMSTLEKMEHTLKEVVVLLRDKSGESWKQQKLSIISTESNQMAELKNYIYAVIELITVVSILKHSNSLERWLTKDLSILTKKKENIYSISTFGIIIEAINDIGYTVDFNVLNSKFFDVAQNRERVYLIAVRNDLIKPEPWNNIKGNTMLPKAKKKYMNEGAVTFNFDWPEQIEVRTILKDFLEKEVDDKYYLSEDKTANLITQLENGLAVKEATKAGYSEANEGDAVNIAFPNSSTRRGRVGKQIANTLEASNINQGVVEKTPIMLGSMNHYGNDQMNRVYSTEGLSPTITVVSGGGREQKIATKENSKYRIRKLTPRECLRLQSVPEDKIELLLENFSDSRCYKFAGNGLTTNVIEAIGKKLIKYL